MCGRCACTLDENVLSKACNYKNTSGRYKQVPWFCPNDEQVYKPSSNIGPRDCLPIVISGQHVGNTEKRVLVPMLWGIVPNSWKGDPKKHSATTHNAKIETIQETMYKGPLERGYRCVVVVEGIYEWKTCTADKTKQPYLIYACQKDGVQIEKPSSWTDQWNEEDGWQGISVLKMAGLFSQTKNIETGNNIYSFTIITRDSNDVLSWCHHRMPIFLTNPDDEEIWLNDKQYKKNEALSRILNLNLTRTNLSWHPVSSKINNIHNKQLDLLMPVKTKEEKRRGLSNFMQSWLTGNNSTNSKRKSGDEESDAEKKVKR